MVKESRVRLLLLEERMARIEAEIAQLRREVAGVSEPKKPARRPKAELADRAPKLDASVEMLTTAEVAEILRMPVSTLRYWRHRGNGPRAMKVGRRVLYEAADVRSFFEGQRDTYDPRRQ